MPTGAGAMWTATVTAGSPTRAGLGCRIGTATGCGSTTTAGIGSAASLGDGLPTIGGVGTSIRRSAGAGSRALPVCDTLGGRHWWRSSGTQPSRPAGFSRVQYMEASAGSPSLPASASCPGTGRGTTRATTRSFSITASKSSTTIATRGMPKASLTSTRAIWGTVRDKRRERSAPVSSGRQRRSADRCRLFHTVPAKARLSLHRARIGPQPCRTSGEPP